MIDFNELKKKRIDGIGLPEWLCRDCDSCGCRLELPSILSIGIEMSPKTFGNLSVSYLCSHCSSLIEIHYRKAMIDDMDIMKVLSKDKPPSNPVPFDEVINSMEHNLL